MSFTESEFKKIVETFDRKDDYVEVIKDIRTLVGSVGRYQEINQAILLAIPESRKWAREKYVMKEPRFSWVSKKADDRSFHLLLHQDEDGMVTSEPKLLGEIVLQPRNYINTSALIEWGYEPERFNKELVNESEK